MQKLKIVVKKYKLYLLALLVIVIVVTLGQHFLGNSSTSQSTQQTSLASVIKGSIASSVSASGKVETANYLPINTGVNGIVKKVFVKEGDTVTKGQKIMEITLNSDGEENLASAWASYLSAKNSLAKAKTDLLSKENSLINAKEDFQTEKEHNSYQTHDERISYKLAENNYLSAEQTYDQQQTTIQQAQVSLNKSWLSYQAQSPTIVAPDSGTIANILVVEGMNISNSLSERTSTSVASIKKEGTPIVSLNISELDINSIKVGQKAEITLNSIPGKIFTGTVAGIDKIGEVSSGVTNYSVIVRFDESSDLVLPNMDVDGNIIIEQKDNVLEVPSAAITSERGNTFVTVMDNGTEQKVNVKIGISDGAYTEITSGLTEGQQVVVQALPTSGFTQSQNQRDTFRGPGLFR